MTREVVLDTETTGLDHAEGHRVVEIGCVEMIDGVPSGVVFHTYLNPDRDMPEEARRVHGLTNEFLKNQPRFADKVDAFLAFVANDKLIIHNAKFDMGFINAELGRAGHPHIADDRVIDTLKIARKQFPGTRDKVTKKFSGPSLKLDNLCDRFAIDRTERTDHGALLDAKLLALVYLKLLEGRQNADGTQPLR